MEFRVKCSATNPGEAVFIVGSCPELGAWDTKKGLPCITTAQVFPMWTSANIALPPDAGKVEFKIVVQPQERGNPDKARWEGGANKVLMVPHAKEGGLAAVHCEFGKDGVRTEVSMRMRQESRTLYEIPEDSAPPPEEEAEDIGALRLGSRRANTSRHLLMNSDGSIDVDMSRTPSLMMIDLNDFEAEAETHEKELVELERERLNKIQRRIPSGCLLEEMRKVTDYADPSNTVLLQGFNWNSWEAGKGDWYSIVASKVGMFEEMGITDIWLPPCSQSVAPQGYLPSQLFNLDGSKYGNQASLEALLSKLHDAGIRGVADIVINHRCGDKQDSQGRWNVFTTGMEARPSFAGVMDWQGWAITLGDKFSDGSGQHAPGHYDQKFDAAPDIDHKNQKVQQSINIWMRWLRLQVGFDAWRFDFVKGYGAEYVGLYCKKTEPAWAVGELWCDMEYDHEGLRHNQNKNRQDLCNWVNGTDKTCTAFDFTTKGILQEACRNCQYWRLRDSDGKPPGMLGWMPKYAVTFIDNHDTGSSQGHWPFPNDKVLVGYAYIITHPGIPSVFWDHIMDWGDDHRRRISDLLKARRDSGIPVDAPVSIKSAEHDQYIAEIGSPPALRVALGPKHAGDPGGNYWSAGPAGKEYRVWIHKEEAKEDAARKVLQAEEARKAEEAKKVDAARKAEEARRAEESRKTEEARKAEQAKAAASEASPKSPAFEPPPRKSEQPISAEDGRSYLSLRLPKHLSESGCRVVVCGEVPSLGAWNPSMAPEMQRSEGKCVMCQVPEGVRAGTLFKYVVIKDGAKPKWETGRPDRTWPDLEVAPPTHIFDSTEDESSTKVVRTFSKLSVANGMPADEFAEQIAKENRERPSYRTKLDLSRKLLVDSQLGSLRELACLQAYLTFVASGQIKCEEDGRHFRPCAAANTAKAVTEALWHLAANGDAECFIARRIFPSLPSYADQFTCSVPMTRIRDIAHRGDIPKHMKDEIKHKLQNKLHRCADPGDLVTLDRLMERVHREGCYSPAFVRELEIFHVELREFFNASGLDDTANQVANEDGSVKPAVDKFLGLKRGGADAFQQLLALTELRKEVQLKVEAQQTTLRLDLELEKYSFVLLSQIAQGLDGGGQGSSDWWQRLLRALEQALVQSELSGIAQEECAVVARELAAVGPHLGDASKAPFAPQRAAASADRAMRICFLLQQQLEEAYAGVPALGRALGIDAHAVSVFVEAELRASVLFQISKLVQLAMKNAKVAAGLPLWTAISAGAVAGIVVQCEALSETWSKELPAKGAIVFCNEAGGDEEIPQRCRGIILARELPVLSHLALRARQLGVVFACTSEAKLFGEVKAAAKAGAAVRLTSEASGGVRVEPVSEAELVDCQGKGEKAGDKSKATSGPAKVGELSLKEDKVLAAIDLSKSPQTVGAKAASSGKLEVLAAEGGFRVPKGLAVPFGVMRQCVKGTAFDAALAALTAALDSKSDKIESCAQAVREAVEQCEVPGAVLDALQAGLPKGTVRVAVRSSANSEDLEGVSGAGLHDSVLGVDVQDRSCLQKAVQQVWSSLFTLRAVQSRHAAGMPLFEGIAMGVLVQPMVALPGRAYAFIAFSKDVVGKDTGAVYVEVCVGLGETLASANEPGTPYRLLIRKEAPHEVKVLSLASYSFGLQDAVGGPERTRVDYSAERLSTDLPFLKKVAQDIASVAVCIEKGYGVPMDMEGVVLEESSGREIHLVQARPIVEG